MSVQNYLVKVVPGSIAPDPDGVISYPDARDIAYTGMYNDGSDWEVWHMYSDKSDDDGNPDFAAQPGDTLLGGWERYNDNRQVIPNHPDLLEYIQIGNTLNEETSTFDGTPGFALYTAGLGAPARWWGTTNPAPEDNQTRHVVCRRFVTDWAGQDYYRVRFVLQEPFDKDNTPDALAILIYTDQERQNYYYTPGGFIWDDEAEEWYCETTIGQSPTSGPEPVHYCVALGSAPLEGGGSVPAGGNHESFNWEKNITAAGMSIDDAVAHFQTRMGWLQYQAVQAGGYMIFDNTEWPPGQTVAIPSDPVIAGTWAAVKPAWMTEEKWNAFVEAIEKAAGRQTMNAAP